jgi:hypothetical protein
MPVHRTAGRWLISRRQKKKGSKTSKGNLGKGKAIFWGIGGILAGVIVLLFSFHLIPFIHIENKKGKSFSVFGGETRPVLDPSLFSGMARSAYAAAKEYPQVLNQVYCYCRCDEPPVNHISLLSCFTDRHGAG